MYTYIPITLIVSAVVVEKHTSVSTPRYVGTFDFFAKNNFVKISPSIR
jgi:hypothetical protein